MGKMICSPLNFIFQTQFVLLGFMSINREGKRYLRLNLKVCTFQLCLSRDYSTENLEYLLHSSAIKLNACNKIGNNGINANLVFPNICSFLLYVDHIMLENVI